MPAGTTSNDSHEEFLKLDSRESLAEWLHISDKKLRYLLYVVRPENLYTTFEIRKRRGGVRKIYAPKPALKVLQRRLLRVIETLAKPSSAACAFVIDRSIVTHAERHRKRRWVLCADLENFFPSINFGRVRGVFLAPPFSFGPLVATCLAQLCTDGKTLPQGAPTSPAISNIVSLRLDRRIKQLCRLHRCTYSRYADDICISSNLKQPPIEFCISKNVNSKLEVIINEEGFLINHKKTKLFTSDQRQVVTGLVVNQQVGMPRKWRRQLRVILHLKKKHGSEKALEIASSWQHNPPRRNISKSVNPVISGKAGFAYFLERNRHPVFTRAIFRSYPGSRQLIPKPYKAIPFRLYTEGKTDLLHIRSALKSFQSGGYHRDLSITNTPEPSEKGSGAPWLEARMRAIARSVANELSIGIFDCDDVKFMKSHQLTPGGFVRIGQSTYLLCLGRATWCDNRFCIEDLYRWSEASQWTASQRRLFKRSEFDQFGVDASGQYKMGDNSKSLYVTSSVVRISDNHSCLLSKHDFAEMIRDGKPPFSNIDFSGFNPTFEAIYDLLEDYF